MKREQEREFGAFVAADGPMLLRTAYLLTGDRGHAEDLFQTTLERVARKWSHLDAQPAAYARTVLVHAARDGWRRLKARPVEVASTTTEPSDRADVAGAVALRTSLVAALQNLPSRQRSVLVLRHLLDLSEAETAHTLGISIGTVKSTASAGNERLRALLPDLRPLDNLRS